MIARHRYRIASMLAAVLTIVALFYAAWAGR